MQPLSPYPSQLCSTMIQTDSPPLLTSPFDQLTENLTSDHRELLNLMLATLLDYNPSRIAEILNSGLPPTYDASYFDHFDLQLAKALQDDKISLRQFWTGSLIYHIIRERGSSEGCRSIEMFDGTAISEPFRQVMASTTIWSPFETEYIPSASREKFEELMRSNTIPDSEKRLLLLPNPFPVQYDTIPFFDPLSFTFFIKAEQETTHYHLIPSTTMMQAMLDAHYGDHAVTLIPAISPIDCPSIDLEHGKTHTFSLSCPGHRPTNNQISPLYYLQGRWYRSWNVSAIPQQHQIEYGKFADELAQRVPNSEAIQRALRDFEACFHRHEQIRFLGNNSNESLSAQFWITLTCAVASIYMLENESDSQQIQNVVALLTEKLAANTNINSDTYSIEGLLIARGTLDGEMLHFLTAIFISYLEQRNLPSPPKAWSLLTSTKNKAALDIEKRDDIDLINCKALAEVIRTPTVEQYEEYSGDFELYAMQSYAYGYISLEQLCSSILNISGLQEPDIGSADFIEMFSGDEVNQEFLVAMESTCFSRFFDSSSLPPSSKTAFIELMRDRTIPLSEKCCLLLEKQTIATELEEHFFGTYQNEESTYHLVPSATMLQKMLQAHYGNQAMELTPILKSPTLKEKAEAIGRGKYLFRLDTGNHSEILSSTPLERLQRDWRKAWSFSALPQEHRSELYLFFKKVETSFPAGDFQDQLLYHLVNNPHWIYLYEATNSMKLGTHELMAARFWISLNGAAQVIADETPEKEEIVQQLALLIANKVTTSPEHLYSLSNLLIAQGLTHSWSLERAWQLPRGSLLTAIHKEWLSASRIDKSDSKIPELLSQ